MPLLERKPEIWRITTVLTAGILAVASSAILVRLAVQSVNSVAVTGVGFSLVLAASRLTLAAIVLLPVWRQIGQQNPSPLAWRHAVIAGLVLALHFAAWITSLSYTSIAASTALVTTNPIWIALLSWLWWGEKPGQRTAIGILIALVGGLLVGLGGLDATQAGNNPLLGNGLALMGAWAVSLYFLLGRQAQREGLGISGYVTIAYTTAAIVLLPLPFLLGASYIGYPAPTYVYLLLMALLPQLVGHTSLNWAIRWVSPTLVALLLLFEPVLASLLGYWIFKEQPGVTVLVGTGVLLVGVALAAIEAGRE